MLYKFMTPTLMEYGLGAVGKLGSYLEMYNCKKAMIVCDKGVAKAGHAAKVAKIASAEGFTTILWDRVVANAPIDTVREGKIFAEKEGVNVIIGLGGGSAMDTARAISMAMTLPLDIGAYMDFANDIDREGIPMIAIPTTAGTGSEVSTGAVIYEPEKTKKSLLLSTFAAAKVALIDGNMSRSMPPQVTAATGVDALTHALEAYTTTLANPLEDAIALKAAEMVLKYLPRAYRDANDMEARQMMAEAATMGAMCFNSSELHILHAIAHPITAYWNIPHGVACAWALLYGMASQAPAIEDRIKVIVKLFGIKDTDSMKVSQLVNAYESSLEKFYESLNIPKLGTFTGVKKGDYDAVADAILVEAESVEHYTHISPDKAFYIDVLKKAY